MKTETLSVDSLDVIGAGPAVRPRPVPVFDKILVANRGEIACRIMKTARQMGIRTVAIYSEPDQAARHVRLADESVCVGGGPAAESYLDAARILEACRQTGARAIHPGYGFLSESADFARQAVSEGLSFIGPDHQAIAAMGDKIAAKTLATAAKVNVIPGWNAALQSVDQALEKARHIGYPVMLKASAGGGGRGLRLAQNDADLVDGLQACQREALAIFGDDRVFIERAVSEAHHVEVQVLADSHGNCIHLWDRDCSIQRRHQKLIEEAPSPFLDEATRAAMCQQAVVLARAANYRSAGTVEFLVDADRRFYFLEMNTRLQVEHPVTECITGLDLVEWMIRIAAGQRLPFEQREVQRRGWALECRINVDDPSRNFLPSAGRLTRYQPPAQTMMAASPTPANGGIRLDSGVQEGDVISPYYDSMIGKLIVHAADREACIQSMRQALDTFVIRGVASNVAFLATLLAHPDFHAGRCDTAFVAENYPNGFFPAVHPDEAGLLMALAVAVHVRRRHRLAGISGQVPGFEARPEANYLVVVGDGSLDREQMKEQVRATARVDGKLIRVHLAGADYPITLSEPARDVAVRGDIAGLAFRAQVERIGFVYHVSRNGSHLQARVISARAAALGSVMPARVAKPKARRLLSPMPGRLVDVPVLPGQRVCTGEPLAVIEAMKMENVLTAAEDGVIASVFAKKGDSLAADQLILDFQ